MHLGELNGLNDDAAMRAFLQCCGSTRWARRMTAARPFVTADAMADAADRIWTSLDPPDWLEAFGAHPRIGSGRAGGAGGAGGPGGASRLGGSRETVWSASEQAGVASAAVDVLQRLAAANREYEARFGYIFIVCATGKTAAEMLQILERRLPNAADVEMNIAAEEQRKITRLRLAKLLEREQLPTP
jgi:2-oxo-4-hydroxy-4-carboxy-5-ureidoimidazoline decarboxylase